MAHETGFVCKESRCSTAARAGHKVLHCPEVLSYPELMGQNMRAAPHGKHRSPVGFSCSSETDQKQKAVSKAEDETGQAQAGSMHGQLVAGQRAMDEKRMCFQLPVGSDTGSGVGVIAEKQCSSSLVLTTLPEPPNDFQEPEGTLRPVQSWQGEGDAPRRRGDRT